jgi:hypothetical protein
MNGEEMDEEDDDAEQNDAVRKFGARSAVDGRNQLCHRLLAKGDSLEK